MDEVDEVFANGEEVQSDLKKKSSSARARLQYPNRETPAHCHCFRNRCFLIWDRLGLLTRNYASSLFRSLADGTGGI